MVEENVQSYEELEEHDAQVEMNLFVTKVMYLNATALGWVLALAALIIGYLVGDVVALGMAVGAMASSYAMTVLRLGVDEPEGWVEVALYALYAAALGFTTMAWVILLFLGGL
jgi:hypothetical protein